MCGPAEGIGPGECCKMEDHPECEPIPRSRCCLPPAARLSHQHMQLQDSVLTLLCALNVGGASGKQPIPISCCSLPQAARLNVIPQHMCCLVLCAATSPAVCLCGSAVKQAQVPSAALALQQRKSCCACCNTEADTRCQSARLLGLGAHAGVQVLHFCLLQ